MRLSLAAAACLLTACTPATHTALRGPPVVFIHGIKGSSLVDRDGSPTWLSAATVLRLQTPDLRLPLTWHNGEQDRDGMQATAPLLQVTLIPKLVQQQVYGPFVEAMRAADHPFYAFSYDWRRDNLETLDKFLVCLRHVQATHQEKVRVVAHSMGGLVALAALHAEPQAIRDVVFAGVPFVGGIGFLKDIHAGVATGLNKAVLSPQVIYTHPSVYTFFPLGGDGLITPRGEPIPVDFFAPAAWETLGLGMFAPGRLAAAGTTATEVKTFLSHALPRARSFRERLAPQKMVYPPILAVTGHCHPTLMQMVRNGPKSCAGWDFETAPQDKGDGRVAVQNAVPYPGIPYQQLRSTYPHAELLNDPVVLDAIRAL
jgi:pimeloyl-ACP methyl ester carboxylesterase